jgi:hypothetical protein
MTYTVKKLTKQYNGFGHFKYIIQPTACSDLVGKDRLSAWREWCWETWGAGRELEWALAKDSVWCWSTEFKHKRIYLKSDAELVLFQLKW